MTKATPVIGFAALIAAIAALFWFGGDETAAKDRQLDASLIGTDGLQIWLQDQGIEVVHSNPRLTLRADGLSLAILPLYDIDLEASIKQPLTPEDEMQQSGQRDLDHRVLQEKLNALPSLVVLPKWRTGFVKSAVAHDSTLVPIAGIGQLLRQMALPLALAKRVGPKMTEISAGMTGKAEQRIALFWAQVFARAEIPAHCHETLGIPDGALVIFCNATVDMAAAHYLSDPDLLNNHGLGLARNATLAADLMASLRPDARKPVYLDTSPQQLLITDDVFDEAQEYDRGWAEFVRFFDYPLSVLWAVAAVILGLAGWRGARRFGPARGVPDDGLPHSKTVSIDARARLLRLSGNDGRMVAEFVLARLDALAESSFGTGGGAAKVGGHERLFKLLARRDAALAARFQSLCTDLMARGPAMTPTELYQHLATFRDLLERLTHGPDPISKPD